jgi:glycosyltransferase involved in cell wall biosynthesis
MEQSFLADEIIHLQSNFKKLYIVPQRIEGDLFELPEGIEMDDSLAKSLTSISLKMKVKALLSKRFISELKYTKLNRVKIKYAIAGILAAMTTEKWVKSFLKKKGDENCVFYSFWMDASTVGFTMAKQSFPSIGIVTRCHNFDLYGNEDNQFYVPFFQYTYSNLDLIFPDSTFGREYLSEKCPEARIEDGIMGVSHPGFVNEPSQDGVFRILSCAYMIPRKRVELLGEAIQQLMVKHPMHKIVWYHIGAGPLWENIVNFVEALKSENCEVNLLGNLSHEEMMEFYKTTPLDLFVNSSTKEGTPVSLMEAISCSIPILVTGFGGNKEMAESGAGWVLSEDPDVEEFSSILHKIITDTDRAKFRQQSLEVWKENYYSETNYLRFCEKLESI